MRCRFRGVRFVVLVSGAEGTADPTDERAPVGEFMESTFRRLLGNTLVTGVTSTFLWFALTFWVFLRDRVGTW